MPPEQTQTCPFCALHCDDVHVRAAARPRPTTKCPIALDGYHRADLQLKPQIDGKPVSMATACREAARLLTRARHPLYAGLATDVAGMRAVVRLAERTGGVLDHANGDIMQVQSRLLKERGWISTTLGELRRRADLLVLLGTDAVSAHPRFFERIRASRGRQPLKWVQLGGKSPGQRGTGRRAWRLDCPNDALGEVARALTLRLRGHPLPARRRIGGLPASSVERLARKLSRAHYSVLAWEPARLPTAQAALQVHAFCDLIQELNQTTRSAGLALGGEQAAGTAQTVCTWLSGHPLRVGYPRRQPQPDPTRYDWRRMLAGGDTDLLVWITAFDGGLLPELPRQAPPLILLARADRPPPPGTHIYIPIATPGIEHPGHLFRLDGVIAVHTRGGLRPARHPAAASALSRIEAQLPPQTG